ncbi:MAG TPA: UDP-N-acetylmuramoyl-L-alanine--D-glutamate ligase [Candidatus Kryptonia bacterium]|nr:UDP-N-acetylmuramoyl-L-alanine--D-glutamate ligase [Candidatus Kryptonia bacterium]
MNLTDRSVLVVGAGRTGQSVARFLAGRGAVVRLTDRRTELLDRVEITGAMERVVDDGGDTLLRGIDLVVPSPGVPRTHAALQLASARGISVMSEIELAYRFLPCPLLAITGTNGKSTTTTLLGAMLAATGDRIFVGGNLGTPLIDAVQTDGPAYVAAVAEISSFQLEWVQTFRPRVGVLLNLTPDHLDRYADLADYGAAKAALLARQRADDFAVLNRDDPWVWEQRHRTRATAISFGREPVEFGAFIDGDALVYWGPDPQPRRFPLEHVRLHGAHNHENMLAAITAASVWGVPADAVQRALEETDGLPHRLTLVRELDGVRYFDDSKGTNVGAVIKSLESFAGRVILLAGGYDKGGDFNALRPLLRERAKRLICFGAARDKIAAQLEDATESEVVRGLADAVRAAAATAEAGDTVLLSPGCASFDEFTDYTARGRRFRELVEAL